MAISARQAAAALEDIERTEQRTWRAQGYALASPYLILCGLIWIVGYVASAFLPPDRWGLVWLPLAALCALGSAWLGIRARPSGAGGSLSTGGLIGLFIAIFMGCSFFLFRPTSPLPYLVFPALMAGLVYSLAGVLARMPRFIWIGAGILLLTMAGYIYAPAWTAIWVAIAGGGGLVLGGLWLRKV